MTSDLGLIGVEWALLLVKNLKFTKKENDFTKSLYQLPHPSVVKKTIKEAKFRPF
jgi:hypothetical protein